MDDGGYRGTFAVGCLSLSAALAWAFLRVGPQTSTDIADDTARALNWPNPDLDSMQAYTRTSPSGPILFSLSGLESPRLYLLMNVLVALAGILLVAWWAYRATRRADQRFRAARLSILGPAVASVFVSLGNYDSFTMLGVAGLLFAWTSGRRVWLIAAGTYLGFQHFEQGAFAVLAVTVAAFALQGRLPERLAGLRTPLWALPGVLLGKVLLSLILLANGIAPLEGRSAYMTPDLVRFAVKESINNGPVLLLSLFAGLWVVVIVGFARMPTLRARLLLAVAFAIPLAVAAVTLSQTRVFVMGSLPIVCVLIAVVLSDDEVVAAPALVLVIEALAWIVVPQHVYMSPEHGALIFPTNALDYLIMFLEKIPTLT